VSVALLRRSKPAQSDFFPGFTEIVEIGVGSLATVYRAREVGTNRLVALKLLNVRDASPRALESFERESIALGAVSSHPNIVTLFRSFRAADGRPVLVLELCAGAISDRMQGGRGLPVPEVVALGIKIAGALETAHRAEILHRDVKPQNILITGYGEPALADFGVAMLQSSTQTTAGLFDFTTLHAAPELLEGGETSAATDVYELASSVYQLVAGKSAFRAHDGESPASVILRILRDPVQPLLKVDVPTQLSDLLVYAMSKDKDSRPPTAAEFAAELAAIEIEQEWPSTQFLIRDPSAPGGRVGLPSITRIPMRPPLPHAWQPPPPGPVEVHIDEAPDEWSDVSLTIPRSMTTLGNPPPAGTAPPAGRHVAGADGSRLPIRIDEDADAGPPPPALAPAPVPWEFTAEAPPTPPAPAERAAQARQYPIPPAVNSSEPTAGAVPTWAFRAQTPAAPGAAASVSDLTLDPMSLRRRVTIRSGASALVVDDERLLLRVWWRRSEIPWADVLGFEPRFEGVSASGSGGRLVALTRGGPVDLPATKRSMADLRYVHALLDAYRQRGQYPSHR
jgi:serine/threonine protein kinase